MPSSATSNFEHAHQGLAVPQSEYPLNVGKSAVPVEVPVTPKLTPEVLEDIEDEGRRVDDEEGIDELVSVCPFTPRMKESKRTIQKPAVCVEKWWERIPREIDPIESNKQPNGQGDRKKARVP